MAWVEDTQGLIKLPTPGSTDLSGRGRRGEIRLSGLSGAHAEGPGQISGLGIGLPAAAQAFGQWAEVFRRQEDQKQTLEALDEINQARDRQRAMFDQMERMTGSSGVSSPYLAEDFYANEMKTLEGKARGDFQKMLYARFVSTEREQGLNKAIAHRTVEMERYEQSVMAGDLAQFQAIADDPYSSPEDVTRAAIPYLQRQMAYTRKQGLDPRAAAIAANKMYRGAVVSNISNRALAQARSGDWRDAQRVAAGVPQSRGLPSEVVALADKVGAAQGVDPALLKAVIMAESGGNGQAVSKAGARGLMQLMPGTARDLGVNPDDPERNVRGGAEYISRMLEKYNGNLKHALMAYNWGPGNVDKWIQGGGRGSVPKETQNYVRKVMADYSLQKRGGQTGGGAAGSVQLIQPVKGFTKISSGYGNRNTGIPGGRGHCRGYAGGRNKPRFQR